MVEGPIDASVLSGAWWTLFLGIVGVAMLAFDRHELISREWLQ
jgi:hypothetical protein